MSLDERLVATPTAFMNAVWGGLHSLCSDRGGTFHTVGVYDNAADLLDAALAENAAGGNTWFGAHGMSERPATGRGDAGDVTEIRALLADLDWDDEYAHKAPPGSLPTEDEVRQRLEHFEHQPSIVVNSGHGLQVYCLLSSPVPAREGAELTLRLHAALAEAGLPADRADLASVLRLPGTISRKPGCDEVTVVVEQLHNERVYTPQYLAKRLPKTTRCKAAASGATAPDGRRWWASGDIGAGRRHGSLVAAAGWCREMGLTRDEAVPYIRDAWQRHNPQRHTLVEALAVLDDVYDRYTAGNRLADLRRDDNPEAYASDPPPPAPTATGANGSAQRHLVLTPASAIKVRRVAWLWHERFPIGTLGLLAGPEGLGKSTIAYWLASRVTRGDLPGELHGTPKSVLVCATEDSWEHTIVPRLMAHDADLDRVFRTEIHVADITVGLNLPADVAATEQAGRDTDAALLILDPLMSRLDAALDTHRDGDVRRALEPLASMADKANLGVLGLIHHNKSGSTNPLNLVMASKAFTAVARSVHTAIWDPDDDTGNRRLFGTPKNNLGRGDLPAISFATETFHYDTDEGPGQVGRVVWGAEVAGSIQDALRRGDESPEARTARADAVDWLSNYMREHGPTVPSDTVKAAGKAAGVAERTLQRARKELRLVVDSTTTFPRQTFWAFPSAATSRGETHLGTTTTTGTTDPLVDDSRASRASVPLSPGRGTDVPPACHHCRGPVDNIGCCVDVVCVGSVF